MGNIHTSRPKSSPNRTVKLPAASIQHRQRAVFLKQTLLLRQFTLTFKFKWCHGQAQASTVLVAPAHHMLSTYLIHSSRSASTGDLHCPGTAAAHHFCFCSSEKVLVIRVIWMAMYFSCTSNTATAQVILRGLLFLYGFNSFPKLYFLCSVTGSRNTS